MLERDESLPNISIWMTCRIGVAKSDKLGFASRRIESHASNTNRRKRFDDRENSGFFPGGTRPFFPFSRSAGEAEQDC